MKRFFSIDYDVIDIDGVDNEILSKEILSNKDKRLNTNPLQSQYEDTELLKTKSSEKLMSKIDDELLKIDTHFYITDIWAHIIEPNQSTMYHDHRGAQVKVDMVTGYGQAKDTIDAIGRGATVDLTYERDGVSFVYYVTYPKGSGNLIFDFDVLSKRVCKSIEPKVGQLILFPTYIPHYTTRNVSDEIRISISGNYFSNM